MSNYFNKFPNTSYEFNRQTSVVKDIFRRSAFVSEYRPYSDLFEGYLIKDGETPEFLSMKFYGDSSYHWLLMVFNEIHNIHSDWPMNQLSLEQYCQAKYGEYAFAISHYEIDGQIVGEVKTFSDPWVPPPNPYPGNIMCIPMTFFDAENTKNDAKRNIKILRPELIREFSVQFERSIR